MKNKIKIIYEDNHLLVCEKPVNMPVQADSSGDEDLLSTVKAYIKEKYSKPGEVYLGLVHRLDRPVGGVMVFARTSKAAARLTESFKNRKTKKRYAAIVSGSPCSSAELECDLLRDEQNNISRVVRPNTPGAKAASLEYVSTVTKNGFTLLDVLLHTGRHHQIRAQLAWSGCPIFGDQRYNRAARVGQQIALYAYSLTIEHPTLRESMTFTCIPHGAKFDEFSDECAALAAGVRCAYIDNNLICVNKNAGISCTVEDGGSDTLEARLNSAFGKVYPCTALMRRRADWCFLQETRKQLLSSEKQYVSIKSKSFIRPKFSALLLPHRGACGFSAERIRNAHLFRYLPNLFQIHSK